MGAAGCLAVSGCVGRPSASHVDRPRGCSAWLALLAVDSHERVAEASVLNVSCRKVALSANKDHRRSLCQSLGRRQLRMAEKRWATSMEQADTVVLFSDHVAFMPPS